MTPKDRILMAVEKGYYVDERGNVFSKHRQLFPSVNRDGYMCIGFKHKGSVSIIFVHRLMGYQKFGDSIFEGKIQVRHLDGNRSNNSIENISIGTSSENRMDILREKRLLIAKKANEARGLNTPTVELVEQLLYDRSLGLTISEISKKYSITRDRYYYVTRYSSVGVKFRLFENLAR